MRVSLQEHDRDERGMSRMDCLFIQLMLVVLAAFGLNALRDDGDLDATVGEMESRAAASTETGTAFLGLSNLDIVMGLLAVVALVFIIRLVVEARS